MLTKSVLTVHCKVMKCKTRVMMSAKGSKTSSGLAKAEELKDCKKRFGELEKQNAHLEKDNIGFKDRVREQEQSEVVSAHQRFGVKRR